MVHWNNPFPVKSLEDECINAARVVDKYINTGSENDMIPESLLHKCRGIAVITVVKAGFVVSGRIGSGVVLIRTPVTGWSAPSCISMFGVGLGLQLGGELSDFVFLLMDRGAVEAFCRNGNISIGANVTCALGPYGRNAEVDVALFSGLVAYSKSKGFFGGVSLEGTLLVRNDVTNRIGYDAKVSPRQLLTGHWPVPDVAKPLHRVLETRLGKVEEHRKYVPMSSLQQQKLREQHLEQSRLHGIPPPPDLLNLSEHQPTAAGVLPPGIAVNEGTLGAAGDKKVLVDHSGRMVYRQEVDYWEKKPRDYERRVITDHEGNTVYADESQEHIRRIIVDQDGGLVLTKNTPTLSEVHYSHRPGGKRESQGNIFISGPYAAASERDSSLSPSYYHSSHRPYEPFEAPYYATTTNIIKEYDSPYGSQSQDLLTTATPTPASTSATAGEQSNF